MIFVVSHRRREEGGEDKLTKINREIPLGFGDQTQTLKRPPTLHHKPLLLDPSAVHSRLDKQAELRKRDMLDLRKRTASRRVVVDKQFLRPYSPPPPHVYNSSGSSSYSDYNNTTTSSSSDYNGSFYSPKPTTTATTPPKSSSHKRHSPISPIHFQDSTSPRSTSPIKRGMDEEDEFRPIVVAANNNNNHSSYLSPIRASPSPTHNTQVTGLSDNSDSDLDLSDYDSREFCRARRINSLQGRREQILIILDTVPTAREKYTKELAEVDALLLHTKQASLSPFKLAPQETSKLQEDDEPIAAPAPPPIEEEEFTTPTETVSPPPPPPPPPAVPSLATFDWTAFYRAYVDRLVANSQLTMGENADLEFERMETALQELGLEHDRRQVFQALNELWCQRKRDNKAVLPSEIGTFVQDLLEEISTTHTFAALSMGELEDYILRHVTKAMPARFFIEDVDVGPFLEEDFDQIEADLLRYGREQRRAVFDAVRIAITELYPGMDSNFKPPPVGSAVSIKHFVRYQRRPASQQALAEEVKQRLLRFAPLTFWGSMLMASDATVIAQNLAKHSFALEEETWAEFDEV